MAGTEPHAWGTGRMDRFILSTDPEIAIWTRRICVFTTMRQKSYLTHRYHKHVHALTGE